MRAKFIRDQENPLDSLEIGRVLERKLEQKGEEIVPYLEKLSNDYDSSDIKSIINLENRLIQKSFALNNEEKGLEPTFYITYTIDFGLMAGWYIKVDKDSPYIGDELPFKNLDECIHQLIHWIKYYKNYI